MQRDAEGTVKPFGDFDAVFEHGVGGRRLYAAIMPAAVNKDEDRAR